MLLNTETIYIYRERERVREREGRDVGHECNY